MADPELGRAGETEAGYDAVAHDYTARAANRSPDAEQFVTRFVDSLPAQSIVIDLGCGPGQDLTRFAGSGHHPIGVDRSTALLALADPAPLVRADLTQLPIAAGSADALWSHASLLHVEPAALAAALAEWERVLRPGGTVGLSTSLGGDSGWELVPAGRSRRPDMPAGTRRWFVHHDSDRILDIIRSRGWSLQEVSVRSSHRDWLQILAHTPLQSAPATGRTIP
ncbi:MAG: class I SAM-dependent methyltransferase [Sulfitobacter sp.]|nr:class I SAM-dependent methyltransferase [Sulfitobacter sp.]